VGDRKAFLPSLIPIAIFALAFIAVTFLLRSQSYLLMLTLVCVWAVMGTSWNLISGYSGLISFGHAAFFGLGAYTAALLLVHFGLTPWIGIPIAAVVGGMAGALVGIPTFRLRGHYFALAMLAYPLALLYLFEWLGYQEVSIPMMRENPVAYMQFRDYRIYALIGLCFVIVALVISKAVECSRFGMSLLAIKQNEIAAEASGIDALAWKMRAIMLSGAVGGAIGGFYAMILLLVTPPAVFGVLTSAQALIVTLFGGVGAAWGPIIGASILIPLSEELYSNLGHILPGIQGVVFGIAIILVILLAPEGIYWKIRDLFQHWRGTAPSQMLRPEGALAAIGPAPGPRHGGTAGAAYAHPQTPPSGAQPSGTSSRPGAGKLVLEVRGMSKSFGGLKAVDDVSFAVPAGSILGIIGPNGAGKTTLFNLINGILPSDSGEVLLEGENILGLRPNKVCRRGIGRTFQIMRPFPRLTVLQNVVVGAFVATSSDEKAGVFARQALERVGLSDDAHRIAGGLTTKQLRLTELARALAGQPKFLLLDETLAGLGAQEIEELLAVIRTVADDGVTIVIIEHTMQAMVRLADRFIVLDHGAVLAEGIPEEVTKNSAVIEAYLGKKWSARAGNH